MWGGECVYIEGKRKGKKDGKCGKMLEFGLSRKKYTGNFYYSCKFLKDWNYVKIAK